MGWICGEKGGRGETGDKGGGKTVVGFNVLGKNRRMKRRTFLKNKTILPLGKKNLFGVDFLRVLYTMRIMVISEM